jgi:hypothetical protein
MSSPVLTINNKVALVGQLPNLEKIKEIITSSDKPITDIKAGGCSCGGKC